MCECIIVFKCRTTWNIYDLGNDILKWKEYKLIRKDIGIISWIVYSTPTCPFPDIRKGSQLANHVDDHVDEI